MDTGSIANQLREEKDPQIDGSIMCIYIYIYYIFHIPPFDPVFFFQSLSHRGKGVNGWPTDSTTSNLNRYRSGPFPLAPG